MSFTIEARNSAGAVSFSCSTASEAVDKVLELERHYGEIAVKDGTGRTIDRITQARLCRCGGSRTKPFCDSTHLRIGFEAPGS